MEHVIADNYLCFLSLLEMIIWDSTSLRLTQHSLVEEFGIIVPYGYTTSYKNVKFSSVENDYGVHISEEELQRFFNKRRINLRIKYIDSTRINELDLDVRFERYLEEKKYVILAYSYGTLYNKPDHINLGHVALLEKVIGEDIIQIYDPGPDKAGIKNISILKMYDAMRRKGGIYTIEKK